MVTAVSGSIEQYMIKGIPKQNTNSISIPSLKSYIASTDTCLLANVYQFLRIHLLLHCCLVQKWTSNSQQMDAHELMFTVG